MHIRVEINCLCKYPEILGERSVSAIILFCDSNRLVRSVHNTNKRYFIHTVYIPNTVLQ